MEYLVTAQEMKQYDTNTIMKIGIPGTVLMERAALATFEVIEAYFADKSSLEKSVLIMVGMGNNGGDGLALARMLSEAGYIVFIQCVGQRKNASQQWNMQKAILEHFPVIDLSDEENSEISGKNRETEYTIIVDALFGVGLSRNIEGEYARAIEKCNQYKGFKLSLDIPSGIDSDTGRICGCAVRADATITFGFFKRGLMFFPGREYAGEIIKAPIGISERSFYDNPPEMFFYNEEPKALLPTRQRDGNKGTFGKVLLIAGSEKMAGACVLAAKATYRIGAGMVKVISPLENRVILQKTVPEALYGEASDLEDSFKWADVIAIGPGIGTGEYGMNCLKKVIEDSKLPVLLDADALNLLAVRTEWLVELGRQGWQGRKIVITPHVGELSRLLQCPIARLKENLVCYAKEMAKKLNAVVVAKDATTFICREEGTICVNVHGNSGMATAGSGDVLTGVIIGLMAQKQNPFQAAGIGVYLHARAGDRASEILGEHGCMAQDLLTFFQ